MGLDAGTARLGAWVHMVCATSILSGDGRLLGLAVRCVLVRYVIG